MPKFGELSTHQLRTAGFGAGSVAGDRVFSHFSRTKRNREGHGPRTCATPENNETTRQAVRPQAEVCFRSHADLSQGRSGGSGQQALR